MYQRLSKSAVANVIKVGTFCRTMWVLFPVVAFSKMIRQVSAHTSTHRDGSCRQLQSLFS